MLARPAHVWQWQDRGVHDISDVLAGPVLEVAPRLLGALFEHGGVTVRVTEVEAYDGPGDPGSHAHRGPTRATR